MNNIKAILIVIVLIIIGFFVYRTTHKPVAVAPTPVATTAKGCYVAHLAKDVYTLNVTSQTGENVTGTLAFKNFEKDSSSGTIAGTYKDGVLLADYTFNSEGMTSVRQVIFKKMGDNFVEGFADITTDGDREVFTSLGDVTYDPNSTFVATANCTQ